MLAVFLYLHAASCICMLQCARQLLMWWTAPAPGGDLPRVIVANDTHQGADPWKLQRSVWI